MKKIITMLVIMLVTVHFLQAQSSISFENKTLSITRSKDYDKIIYVKVNATNISTATSVPVLISGVDTSDYFLMCKSINFSPAISQTQQIPLTLKLGKPIKDTDKISLSIIDITTNETLKLLISVTAEMPLATSSYYNSKLMFLNAYNFDFGQTKLNSNYVGHLNLFAPGIINDKWGFNTGMMKIDYGLPYQDTATTLLIENVKISPLDELKDGTKYLHQFNDYKSTKRNTSWSFYVQPLYEITNKISTQHIFIHGHIELLSSKFTVSTTTQNVKQDTSIYNILTPPSVMRSGFSNTSTYISNSVSGYFGVGFTFDLHPWDGGKFFFQPTLGISTLGMNYSNISKQYQYVKESNSFYLVRSYYTQDLNKKGNSALIIGIDIRGFLPTYTPQYAAYVGLNIGLESIINLVK